MDKQNETRRVMMTLSDQAIAKLDHLVAEKQRELNQNPELAKYNLRSTNQIFWKPCCLKVEQ